MLKPLFDRHCQLMAWIEPNKHIWDKNGDWIAFISDGHVRSSVTGNWMGPIIGLVCIDREGKPILWNDESDVEGIMKPEPQVRANPKSKPIFPGIPTTPIRPMDPIPPTGGCSSLSFQKWVNQ